MSIIHAKTNNFDSLLQNNPVALVDFFATWCGPCKMVAPFMEQLSTEFEGKAAVIKIDIDEELELATKYGIESIPTVILFKNGKPVKTEVGAHQKDFYADLIKANL